MATARMKPQGTPHCRMTDEQMKALEQFIAASKDASRFAKQTLLWLLRRTENLTKPVSLSFPEEHKGLGQEAAFGCHDLKSTSGVTHLNLFLKGMDTPMRISQHEGTYVNGRFSSEVPGYTIWIAPNYYDDEAIPQPLMIRAMKTIKLPEER